MAYDSASEQVRAQLLSVVGASFAGLDLLELWSRYLITLGLTSGSLLDRMAAGAKLAGVPLSHYINYGPFGLGEQFGAELAPVVGVETTAYTLIGTNPPTHDAAGIAYAATAGGGAAWVDVPSLKDNTPYRGSFTMDQYTSGVFRLLVYGATTNHLAKDDSLIVTGPGTYTWNQSTVNTGSIATEIRMQCTTGPCTARVTAISVKERL